MTIPPFKVRSPEEREKWRMEREDDRRRRSAGDFFNPVNLGHWLELCRHTRVPCVPAEEVARVPVEDILRFDEDPVPETVPAFYAAVTAAMAARPGHMIRWSCCSVAEIKYRLGNGEPAFRDEFAQLPIDDFRAYDLVSDFPELTIAAYARPWMDAAIIDNYPVEYRVFVDHGTIMGICNYYPQRALQNDTHTLNDIGRVFALAARMIVAQKKPMNWPPIEKNWDTTMLSCSMDFMRLRTGEVVFLEGGPPYSAGGGSHPCCFAGRDPEGIAFESSADGLASMGLIEAAE